MWEIIGPISEQYGLPVGLLLVAVGALALAWKRERDDNRLLNKHLQKSAKETTAALVAVKGTSEAQKDLLSALDNRLTKLHDIIVSTSTAQRDQYDRRFDQLDRRYEQCDRRLEAIEKSILELRSLITEME